MRKTSCGTYLIAFVFLILGVILLIAFGLRGSGAYFVTVAEALHLNENKPVNMKIFGMVAPEGSAPLPDGAGVVFSLADLENPAASIRVRFVGVVPPLFKPGAEVIARGAYDPQRSSFNAEELITKCPSKYEKQNRGADE